MHLNAVTHQFDSGRINAKRSFQQVHARLRRAEKEVRQRYDSALQPLENLSEAMSLRKVAMSSQLTRQAALHVENDWHRPIERYYPRSPPNEYAFMEMAVHYVRPVCPESTRYNEDEE